MWKGRTCGRGILFQRMGGGWRWRWRSFQTNVIVHNGLERARASGLGEEDGVIAGDQPISWNVNVVKPIQTVNAVSCNGIVPPDKSAREHCLCFGLINSNLQNSKLSSHSQLLGF